MNEDAVRLWIRRAESDLKIRYDEEIFPSLEETKQALEFAERVKMFVLKKLKEKGFKP